MERRGFADHPGGQGKGIRRFAGQPRPVGMHPMMLDCGQRRLTPQASIEMRLLEGGNIEYPRLRQADH